MTPLILAATGLYLLGVVVGYCFGRLHEKFSSPSRHWFR